MEIVCRKRTEAQVWHICVDCTAWPTRDYSEKWVELTSIDPSTICLQCLQRKREGKCRMCDPHTLYELESSGTKLRQLINLAGRWRACLKGFWPLIWNSLSSL
jgi:hypothetical protein